MEKNRFILLNGKLTIVFPKEIDHHSAEHIRFEADRILGQHPVSQLILDFHETDFMDSSGIGVIVGRYKTVSYMGGTTVAIHVNEQIRRILHVAGLDQLLEIVEEEKGDTY